MANSYGANVIFVDTSAAFPHIKNVVGIKYIGASASSVEIKAGASSSGKSLYLENGTANKYEEIKISDRDGIYVAISGTATCYIYSEPR